jgi:threonine dehydrogenase-like Zn-dependent dehydrogenase
VRAFVVTAPGRAAVEEVEPPRPGPGEVVIDVARVGLCGTDVEFFTGDMAYLHQGHAKYPMRLGHEWCGTVSAVGDGVDPGRVGRRTTGDTMLSCHRCARCLDGRGHLCDDRFEVGIRGWPGALAEQLLMPAAALQALPDSVDDVAGALVEPGANALRAVLAADLAPGDRVLILGAGTIGLLCAMFALADGAEVHVIGRSARSIAFAGGLGLRGVWGAGEVPRLPFDAVIDASNDPSLPALALDLVEPGKRVVYIGLAGVPSSIDTRMLALRDVTAVGILSGSPGLVGAIDRYASGVVDPRPLVAATIRLDQVAGVLAGERPAESGPGPKVHVDPRA